MWASGNSGEVKVVNLQNKQISLLLLFVIFRYGKREDGLKSIKNIVSFLLTFLFLYLICKIIFDQVQ